MRALRVGSDVTAFVLELAAIAALVWAAVAIGPGVAARVGLAVAGVGLFVLVWGRWLAPRADRRLAGPALLVVKAAVFAVSFGVLAVAGQPAAAAVCGLVAAAHLGLAAVNGWL
jgi:uncharacterized protein DUF2568